MLIPTHPDSTTALDVEVTGAGEPLLLIAGMSAHRQMWTDELLDAMVPLGRADLVQSFAFPLPLTVISELLGVPVADRAALAGVAAMVTVGVLASAAFTRFRSHDLHRQPCGLMKVSK